MFLKCQAKFTPELWSDDDDTSSLSFWGLWSLSAGYPYLTSRHVDVESLNQAHDGEAHHIWTRIVENYTTRQLSHSKDRLPALSALAQRFSSSLGDYLAGLWRKYLLPGLMWYIYYPNNQRVEYLGLSWSWASVLDSVQYSTATTNHPLVEIMDCSIKLSSAADPYGRVIGGEIVIKGFLRETEPEHLESKLWDEDGANLETSCGEALVFMPLVCSPHGEGRFASCGLILEESPSPEKCYRRVGWFKTYVQQGPSWWSRCDTVTLKII